MTNAAGQPTDFVFVPIQGGRKLKSISRKATSTCPAAVSTTFYDPNGWVDYTLDWNGNKTDYSYDSSGKLLQVTTAAGTGDARTTVNGWTGDDLMSQTYQDAGGVAYARVNYTYHPISAGLAYGNVASETWTDLREGGTRQTTYNYAYHPNKVLASSTTTRVRPGGNSVTIETYDTLGNLISVANPIGSESFSNHDGLGMARRHTDINGVVTDFTYHPIGRVLSNTKYLPNGNRTTTYSYANARHVSAIFQADGSVQLFRYNSAERLDGLGNAQNQYLSLGFSVASNTETQSSSRNVPSLSGATPVAVSSGSFASSTELDSLRRPRVERENSGQSLTYTYDNNGNVKTVTDASGRVTQYFYDAQNRVKTIIRPDTGSVGYTYDATGEVASVTDPRGLVTRYTYNGLAQLRTETSPDRGLTTYTYDSAGRLATMTPATGITVTYSTSTPSIE